MLQNTNIHLFIAQREVNLEHTEHENWLNTKHCTVKLHHLDWNLKQTLT